MKKLVHTVVGTALAASLVAGCSANEPAANPVENDTTAEQETTATVEIVETTAAKEETTAAVEETTAAVEETTAAVEETTVPEETVAPTTAPTTTQMYYPDEDAANALPWG